jgi:hypothetical protein
VIAAPDEPQQQKPNTKDRADGREMVQQEMDVRQVPKI